MENDWLDEIHAQFIADSVRVGGTQAWHIAKAAIIQGFKELPSMQIEERPVSGPKRNGIDQGLRRTRNELRQQLLKEMEGAE